MRLPGSPGVRSPRVSRYAVSAPDGLLHGLLELTVRPVPTRFGNFAVARGHRYAL